MVSSSGDPRCDLAEVLKCRHVCYYYQLSHSVLSVACVKRWYKAYRLNDGISPCYIEVGRPEAYY